MNTKYFLRGLGAGIILSSVVLLIGTTKNTLSDSEIKQRALKLGMIEKKDTIDQILEKKDVVTSSAIATQGTESNQDQSQKTDNPSEDAQVKKQNDNQVKTETKKEVSSSKMDKKQQQPKSTNEIVLVEIKPGMWSDEIAKTFYDLQLVKDSEEFDSFLCDNGYASLIRVGSYKVPKGATYEEIAKIITK